jgi:hypothetical protein
VATGSVEDARHGGIGVDWEIGLKGNPVGETGLRVWIVSLSLAKGISTLQGLRRRALATDEAAHVPLLLQRHQSHVLRVCESRRCGASKYEN